MTDNFHAQYYGKGLWAVRRSGAHRASKVGLTRHQAIALVKARAREAKSIAWIHGTDGRIISRVSFEP